MSTDLPEAVPVGTTTNRTVQRGELHRTIWKIANNLRGSIDGWEFKQYVLGFLFYRYISENITHHINKDEGEGEFEKLSREDIPDATRNDIISEKGFFIYPDQLFASVLAGARTNANLNIELKQIFKEIEASAVGFSSENDFKGLFEDIDPNSSRLGSTVEERNALMVKVMESIASMELGGFEDNSIDAFGDAYEYLMGMYASQAGKSGGEYFTPQEVSELLVRLTTVGKTSVNKVYDPTCGSGSLLLKFKKVFGGNDDAVGGYYGQELNLTTYNLARINMFLHGVNYSKFDIAHGNTLTSPKHLDAQPFDAIVANPPYSVSWEGDAKPTLITDERFAPAGTLAPKSKADLAFVMHSLHHLSAIGTAAIVEFPGVLYRSGAEQKIRKYLVDANVVDTIIQLPEDLFYGTSIGTCIIVLKKNKKDNKVLFIDASKEFVREGKNNVLSEANSNKILDAFKKRETIEHFTHLATPEEVKANDYTLSVTDYVTPADTREVIDIVALNAEIDELLKKNDDLRAQIKDIISQIEGQ